MTHKVHSLTVQITIQIIRQYTDINTRWYWSFCYVVYVYPCCYGITWCNTVWMCGYCLLMQLSAVYIYVYITISIIFFMMVPSVRLMWLSLDHWWVDMMAEANTGCQAVLLVCRFKYRLAFPPIAHTILETWLIYDATSISLYFENN